MLWAVLRIGGLASATYDDLISPFPLNEIKLTPGSLYDKALNLNLDYILSLDVSRILHSFRLNAGLPSSAQPFTSSWEDPSCEVRGQFAGHYLSALAMLGNHTGLQGPSLPPCCNGSMRSACLERNPPGHIELGIIPLQATAASPLGLTTS